MNKPFKLSAVLILAALGVAGCGVRGNLESPPQAQAASDTTASAGSGQGKAENEAAKPHKGFILDGLLR